MIMGSQQELERRESRKRRRLSERRRVFTRIGLSKTGNESQEGGSMAGESGQSGSRGYRASEQRSESPLSLFGASQSGSNISMKIQFHITVAPGNEPLILETSQLEQHLTSLDGQQEGKSGEEKKGSSATSFRQKSTDSTSIGEHIHERLLNRQNTLSTRRRQQLLALHNQQPTSGDSQPEAAAFRSMPERLASGRPSDVSAVVRPSHDGQSSAPVQLPASGQLGREPGARSSTISGGIADEATIKFLANHHKQQHLMANSLRQASQIQRGPQQSLNPRELIYFKRDGLRFGQEFTLKLSVERTYRCLLKIRPLIDVQSISIQGHQALFVDCNQATSGGGGLGASTSSSQSTGSVFFQPGSAPASTTGLNRSWQNIHSVSSAGNGQPEVANAHRKLNSAGNGTRPAQTKHQASDSFLLLQQQQQNQIMRHFAASHLSGSANPQLGSQLIYMFDWPASRFEVKFYQQECKQHLCWGNQLHFIDYDCSINNLGQIKVDRVQFY